MHKPARSTSMATAVPAAAALTACDAGDARGRSGADGTPTLAVPNAALGRHPELGVAGTDAVDADCTAVATACLREAPAERAGAASPWPTCRPASVPGARAHRPGLPRWWRGCV